MAEILPFMTRVEFQQARDTKNAEADIIRTVKTADDLYQQLYEMSLDDLDHLIKEYKRFGGWNETTERVMHDIHHGVITICKELANGKNKEN